MVHNLTKWWYLYCYYSGIYTVTNIDIEISMYIQLFNLVKAAFF